MLNIENHKLVQLCFNHLLKNTGDLPFVIKPVCPQRDLAAKKAILAYERPQLVTDKLLTEHAEFDLKWNYKKHYDEHDVAYMWAIRSLGQTYGFLSYSLCNLNSRKYQAWPGGLNKPAYNALIRSIYLIPEAQSQGIGGVACAVANDFLMTQALVKPTAIIAHKFADNAASLGLTKPCDGWRHVVDSVEDDKSEKTFALLRENYQPSPKLVPYTVLLPNQRL